MGITRLLLADDHEIVRAGIRKVVEELPEVEVVGEVGNGHALMKSLAELHPDCLLVDIRMPDFNPLTTILQVRVAYPRLRILVVSAFNDDVYVQTMLSAGVNGYHLKDQPLSDLKLAVEHVLAGERWITPSLVKKLDGPVTQPDNLPLLTIRQREILHLLQEGFDNAEIAQETGLSIKTIENHLTRLYRQLRVQSRLEAVNLINKYPEIYGFNEAADEQAAEENQAQKKIGILLVDDNIRYLHQLRRVFDKVYPQAKIYEADDISSAVQLAKKTTPQLVFVDVVLGEEDGIRCARRIKNVSPQSRVVTISAYPDREFHRLSLEAGAVAFLDKKDLDAATLHQVIKDVIA